MPLSDNALKLPHVALKNIKMPLKYLTMLLLLLKMPHIAFNNLNSFKSFKLPQNVFKCLHICGMFKFSCKEATGIETMINLDEIYP